MNPKPGIGSTPDLSLRVSAAALARVIFKHPGSGEWMLALERLAELRENTVQVKNKPFGGAVRIFDVQAVHDLIGDFHFDSERSRDEQDFRLFIQPSGWPALRQFCIDHLSRSHDPILETVPTRELAEELTDALTIDLQPEQFSCKPAATVVENEAAPAANIRARGAQTVRVYRIFEVTITSPALVDAMMKNSAGLTHEQMADLAREDARNGGKGRANAVFVLPLQAITDTFLSIPLEQRNFPIFYEGTCFDETVAAVLEGVSVPKYWRLSETLRSIS